ncbi:unnamed protein product [Closterium sp. NIES-64]|nr:unnamed protein product [Closterium sp. NIES-64]
MPSNGGPCLVDGFSAPFTPCELPDRAANRSPFHFVLTPSPHPSPLSVEHKPNRSPLSPEKTGARSAARTTAAVRGTAQESARGAASQFGTSAENPLRPSAAGGDFATASAAAPGTIAMAETCTRSARASSAPIAELLHLPLLSQSWSPEEDRELERALARHADSKLSPLQRYLLVAACMPSKTARDVAIRCRWRDKAPEPHKRKLGSPQATSPRKKASRSTEVRGAAAAADAAHNEAVNEEDRLLAQGLGESPPVKAEDGVGGSGGEGAGDAAAVDNGAAASVADGGAAAADLAFLEGTVLGIDIKSGGVSGAAGCDKDAGRADASVAADTADAQAQPLLMQGVQHGVAQRSKQKLKAHGAPHNKGVKAPFLFESKTSQAARGSFESPGSSVSPTSVLTAMASPPVAMQPSSPLLVSAVPWSVPVEQEARLAHSTVLIEKIKEALRLQKVCIFIDLHMLQQLKRNLALSVESPSVREHLRVLSHHADSRAAADALAGRTSRRSADAADTAGAARGAADAEGDAADAADTAGAADAGGNGGSGKQRAMREWHPHFLSPLPLHAVRLSPSTRQFAAQSANLEYLLTLDADRLLWSFRRTAGEEPIGKPYGGWENPNSELRGHFVGHYLSASALAWASTGNTTLKARMEYLVGELDTCQQRIGSGYLSAFPEEFFDRVEAIKPVWAPYYTVHKIMAGLLDQYQLGGSRAALRMLTWMVEYFRGRVQRVIERHTVARHWLSLNEEFGGMNDLLYRLYAITRDPHHLELAHLFDKPCFLGPLAVGADDLPGLHANTHIPIAIGAQMRYEATGDSLYRHLSHHFLSLVNTSHSFTSGGTSAFEFWQEPHRSGHILAQEDQESCTTYNMLKMARNAFRWTRSVRFMDYYERAMMNGVMGIQRGTQPGVMTYMLPHGPGNSKARGYHGWGTPFDSFWCCYGTGIESFAKLGDSIYFESPVKDGRRNNTDGQRVLSSSATSRSSSVPRLYVAQFVSSVLTWQSAQLALQMTATWPSSIRPILEVQLAVIPWKGGNEEGGRAATGRAEGAEAEGAASGGGEGESGQATGEGVEEAGVAAAAGSVVANGATAGSAVADGAAAEVFLRIPSWAAAATSASGSTPHCAATLNGARLPCPKPGKFLRVRRGWREGDVIALNISFTLRVECIQDDRPQYASLHSILFGPHLLVGLTDGDRQLIPGFDPSHPATWIRPVDPEVLNQQLISLSLFAPPRQLPDQLPRQQGQDGDESASGSDESAEMYVVWRRSNETQPMAGGTRGNPLVAGLTGGRPGEGTEEAMSATFRVRRPVERKGGDNGLIMKGRGEEEEAGNGEQGERWEQGEKEDEEWRWDSGGMAALIGREISLEPLEIPGSFLAVDWCGVGSAGRTEGEGEVGEGAAAAAAAASGSGGETRRVVWQTRSEMDACRSDILQGGKAETAGVMGACQDGRAFVFRLVAGEEEGSREGLQLEGPRVEGVRLELADCPEWVISLDGGSSRGSASSLASGSTAASLMVQRAGKPSISLAPPLPLSSPSVLFSVHEGLAAGSAMSFIAKGAKRDFLLQPISELRDERYTSYFNVSATPPPAPPSPPPSPPSPAPSPSPPSPAPSHSY